MEFLTSAIRHYADFRGRCTRKPFWMFVVTTHVSLLLLFTPLFMAATSVYTQLIVEQPGFSILAENIAAQDDFTEEHLAMLGDMFCSVAREGAEILLAEHVAALASAGVGWLLGLFLIVPSLSITVRRVRDAGQSPWWVYLSLISIFPLPVVAQVGAMLTLVTFIFTCLPSVKPVEAVTPGQTDA